MELKLIKKKLKINRKIQEKDTRMEIVAKQQIDNEASTDAERFKILCT